MNKRIAKKVLKNQENLDYNKGQVRRANTANNKAEKRAQKAEQAQSAEAPAAVEETPSAE